MLEIRKASGGSTVVEQQDYDPEIKGSNPGAAQYHGKMAQLNGSSTVVKQLAINPKIGGSNPTATHRQGIVAEEKMLEIT